MNGGGQTRARPMVVVLVGLLLALCGAAPGQTGTAATAGPAPAPTLASGSASGSAAVPVSVSVSADPSVRAPSGQGHASLAASHTVREQAKDVAEAQDTEDGAADPGPSRCHKSKGEGQGALPAPSSGGGQQGLPFVLAACLPPESHSALGAAHARPPVRGPAPSPPLTPVELSVLRV